MTSKPQKHTIILIQHNPSYESRTYLDFASVNSAMDALVKMFEHKLKELKPGAQQITYDVSELNDYIDSFFDCCGLVFNPESSTYEPRAKDWIKAKIFQHLKGQAA